MGVIPFKRRRGRLSWPHGDYRPLHVSSVSKEDRKVATAQDSTEKENRMVATAQDQQEVWMAWPRNSTKIAASIAERRYTLYEEM